MSVVEKKILFLTSKGKKSYLLNEITKGIYEIWLENLKISIDLLQYHKALIPVSTF